MMFDHTSTPEKAAQELQRYSNQEISELWNDIDAMEATEAVTTIRTWVELEVLRRDGDEAFDAWLVDFDEAGYRVSPIGCLNRS
jgi:hypothetical protein